MKTLLSKNPLKIVSALLLSVTMLGASSCSKSDKKSGLPQTLNIEYKVTSTSGVDKADLTFVNETAGNTDIDNASIPFTKSVRVTISEPSPIALYATAYTGGSLTLEIIADGKSVKKQTFTGNTSVGGYLHYPVGY